MKCREFTEFILEYLEGTLPDDARAAFERHLSRCDACRTYLSNYRATMAMERQAFEDQDAELPPDVPEELIQAILNTRPR
ncbi:MAG TPA: zf-HC2 domain-containing protein [Vicinamibacterales bacterium]|nr:zf-HC2 domain-containing protein [Vicinamibacterales bacterium]